MQAPPTLTDDERNRVEATWTQRASVQRRAERSVDATYDAKDTEVARRMFLFGCAGLPVLWLVAALRYRGMLLSASTAHSSRVPAHFSHNRFERRVGAFFLLFRISEMSCATEATISSVLTRLRIRTWAPSDDTPETLHVSTRESYSSR